MICSGPDRTGSEVEAEARARLTLVFLNVPKELGSNECGPAGSNLRVAASGSIIPDTRVCEKLK